MKAKLLRGTLQVFRIASDNEDAIKQAMWLLGHNVDDYEIGSDNDFCDIEATQYLDIEAETGVGITKLKIVPFYIDINKLIKPLRGNGYHQAFGSKQNDD